MGAYTSYSRAMVRMVVVALFGAGEVGGAEAQVGL